MYVLTLPHWAFGLSRVQVAEVWNIEVQVTSIEAPVMKANVKVTEQESRLDLPMPVVIRTRELSTRSRSMFRVFTFSIDRLGTDPKL